MKCVSVSENIQQGNLMSPGELRKDDWLIVADRKLCDNVLLNESFLYWQLRHQNQEIMKQALKI